MVKSSEYPTPYHEPLPAVDWLVHEKPPLVDVDGRTRREPRSAERGASAPPDFEYGALSGIQRQPVPLHGRLRELNGAAGHADDENQLSAGGQRPLAGHQDG